MLKLLFVGGGSEVMGEMKRYLEAYDAAIDEADAGDKVFDQIAKASYDFVVANMMMQPINLFPFCRKLRGDKRERVRGSRLLVVGPEEPLPRDFRKLYDLKADYISAYLPAEDWMEKMVAIMRVE